MRERGGEGEGERGRGGVRVIVSEREWETGREGERERGREGERRRGGERVDGGTKGRMKSKCTAT